MDPGFTLNVGADGLATDVPIIAYTERVLEEKEVKLRQYIQDNYSKIRNVEKELANLALEVKLTAGPKKLALEHLRKKIEIATEKVRAARVKEERAKKVWEVAETALQAEEAYKRTLCEDLNRLVQESAAAQFSRLDDLSKRLEALNPDLKGLSLQSSIVNSSNADPSAQSSAPSGDGKQVETVTADHSSQGTKQANGSVSEHRPTDSGPGIPEKPPVVQGKHVSIGRGQRNNSGGQARSAMVLQGAKPSASGWTGAGFDVDGNS